jgi:multicomponent Na+:H+ antiporter subunit E
VKHAISLSAALFVTWMLFSGYFTPLLLGLGVASCLIVVWIAHRMDVIDHEGHPIQLRYLIVGYWGWLLWQIVLANWDVVKRIVHPKLPISPTLRPVRSTQKTDLGRVVFANSITLTPGTVSLRVSEGEVLVHAISREGMDELESGDMDRRVSAVEGAALERA